MVSVETLLEVARGSVIAPAGTGKTDLIARAAKVNTCGNILILTHTHAGVRALKERLRKYGATQGCAKVETITGWCLRYALAYPGIAQLTTRNPLGADWDAICKGATSLLGLRAVQSVVRATYARVFVDEYQDCSRTHHALIAALSEIVPTCVLGDPLQGIFSFAGGTLSWGGEVEAVFPRLGTLSEPWRWHEKNTDLGEWLLQIREPLVHGGKIDLESAPLDWDENTLEGQRKAAYRLLRENGSAVVIRKWPPEAHEFARGLGGTYQSMEEVECKDLMKFCREVDRLAGTRRAMRLLEFAQSCMTEVGPALESMSKVLEAGKVPEPGRYKLQEVAAALAAVSGSSDPAILRQAMCEIERIPGAKIFRRELWQEAHRSVAALALGGYESLFKAAWHLRDRVRVLGRGPERHAVSRTLLIKGLEFDHALVANAHEFYDARQPADAARHFYVAITRGSRSLTVLSKDPQVQFEPCPI